MVASPRQVRLALAAAAVLAAGPYISHVKAVDNPYPVVAQDAASGPRLFFGSSYLPELQTRAQSGVYQSMINEIIAKLNPTLQGPTAQLANPLGTYIPTNSTNQYVADNPNTNQFYGLQYDYAHEARNNATLYAFTGNEQYATRALEMVKALVADNQTTTTVTYAPGLVLKNANNSNFTVQGAWAQDGFKGLTRATSGIGAAIAYDLAKTSTAWQTDKASISTALRANADSLMRNGGEGFAGGSGGNNWWAVRYGATGLVYLATDNQSGTTTLNSTNYTVDQLIQLSQSNMIKYFNNNMNSANPALSQSGNGWSGESVGYVHYPWQYAGPFALALKRLKGVDIFTDPATINVTGVSVGTTPTPSASRALWATYVGMVPIERPGGRGLHADYADDHPVWDGQGTANLAFALSPSQFVGGIKWMYDRAAGTQGDGKFDTERAGGLYGLLYYPGGVAATDPSTITGWGKTYQDQSVGMTMMRNSYDGDQDIVAQLYAKSWRASNGHGGPDMNGFRLLGLGDVWATGSGRVGDPRGQTTVFKEDPNISVFSGNQAAGNDTNSNFGFIVKSDLDPNTGNGYVITESINTHPTTDTFSSNTEVHKHRRTLVTDYSVHTNAEGVFIIRDQTEAPITPDTATASGIGKYWRLNTPEFNTIKKILGDDMAFLIESPDGDRLYAKILWGDEGTIRIGDKKPGEGYTTPNDTVSQPLAAFKRDSATDPNSTGFPFGDETYQFNEWVDFQSADGQFLVVLVLLKAGDPLPTITGFGTNLLDYDITVGSRMYSITGDDIAFSTLVPEPASLSILGLAGAALLLRRRR